MVRVHLTVKSLNPGMPFSISTDMPGDFAQLLAEL